MLHEISYDRQSVIEYAKEWAFKRNPRFGNFDKYGGDCTNFASQCIFAGCKVMNYTPVMGWFFIDLANRTPSWTGVEFLHNFLVKNIQAGPFAKHATKDEMEIGDIIFLQNMDGKLYHSLVVTDISDNEVYVASHTRDAFNKPLREYYYFNAKFIHIIGARRY